MASPINLEVGISGSASSASRLAQQVGGGDISLSLGGSKQTQTLYIVLGAVVLTVALLAMLFRKGRR